MNPVVNQIEVLERLQNKADGYYPKGFFASQRVWLKGLYKREDNTAFFTASVGFILMRLLPLLKADEKLRVASMLENMKPAFNLYRNKDGHPSYNFWETKRGKPPTRPASSLRTPSLQHPKPLAVSKACRA